jgi:hypothetical protein
LKTSPTSSHQFNDILTPAGDTTNASTLTAQITAPS